MPLEEECLWRRDVGAGRGGPGGRRRWTISGLSPGISPDYLRGLSPGCAPPKPHPSAGPLRLSCRAATTKDGTLPLPLPPPPPLASRAARGGGGGGRAGVAESRVPEPRFPSMMIRPPYIGRNDPFGPFGPLLRRMAPSVMIRATMLPNAALW